MLKTADLATARRILGPKAIIGVTTSTIEEALEATKGGADYIGIGTVYATPTYVPLPYHRHLRTRTILTHHRKENAKHIIGTAGVRNILSAIAESHLDVDTVLIGGINPTNIQRILYQSTIIHPHGHLHGPSGIAVVSAIISSPTPESTASTLLNLVRTPPPFAAQLKSNDQNPRTTPALLAALPQIFKRLSTSHPLCHNMTNTVVQNFAANICISLGGSPIMSQNSAEAPDLAALNGSFVLNMGTVTSESLAHYEAAVRAYNSVGGPIVFDPVGGGATAARRGAIKRLMSQGYFDVIKGNESEIQTVLGERDIVQRGVDSGADSSLTPHDKAVIAQTLARRERCVALMTGVIDYISDGFRTIAVKNGHEYLGAITGSGCTLGTTVAAFLAVERGDKLAAVVAGCVVFEVAAERAARRADVRGPGTFVPAFIDELYALRKAAEGGDESWVEEAKVEFVDV